VGGAYCAYTRKPWPSRVHNTTNLHSMHHRGEQTCDIYICCLAFSGLHSATYIYVQRLKVKHSQPVSFLYCVLSSSTLMWNNRQSYSSMNFNLCIFRWQMIRTSNAERSGRNRSPNWLILCFISDPQKLSQNWILWLCPEVCCENRNIYFVFSTFTSRPTK
jgi:hypothetical protein